MFWNALVNFAIAAGGVLDFLGTVGGLFFIVLSILYLYGDRDDGNLFWFVDDLGDRFDDFWGDDE